MCYRCKHFCWIDANSQVCCGSFPGRVGSFPFAFATLSFLETIAQSRNVRIIAMPMDHVKMEHVYVINNIMVNSVKKHFVLIIVMAMELATPKLDVAIARKVLAVSAARKAICAQTSAATMVIVL